jgi:hypothetical protein
MPRKVEAAQNRLAMYSATVNRSQIREQQREKRIAAATASLLTVTNNFDHYLKTMMIAVPITAILLHAVTVKDQTVKLFDITFKLQSAALAITALACVFLLYSARCLLACINTIEQSRSRVELRNYLQNHPGIMNPFYRRIELRYPDAQQDLTALLIYLNGLRYGLRSEKKASDEISLEEQQKAIRGAMELGFENNHVQKTRKIIGLIHDFLSHNMGVILTVFVWIFLVASANKITDPSYNSLYVSPFNDLMRIVRSPLYSIVVLLFSFCFFLYVVALFRSLRIVCPNDYRTRMLTFVTSIFGFSFLSGLVFLIA